MPSHLPVRCVATALCFIALGACSAETAGLPHRRAAELARQIRADSTLREVHQMAKDLLRGGLNAGSGYGEVWIRDLNTFIEVALEVNPPPRLREALLTFFKFQGTNGDIVDGYVPLDRAKAGSFGPGVSVPKKTGALNSSRLRASQKEGIARRGLPPAKAISHHQREASASAEPTGPSVLG